MGEFRPNWLGNLKHNQESPRAQQWASKNGLKFVGSRSLYSPIDNPTTVYTSDYGSFSSQESNHSGNSAIYSNFADCEEALNNLHIPYEMTPPLSPPQPQAMSGRKLKPLPPVPPPRRDSKTQLKKISFDDTAMVRGRTPVDKNEESAPSYATLPRKKKSSVPDSTTSAPSRSTSQVTWMQEIAQRADIKLPDSATARTEKAAPKTTHGILKNGNTTPRSNTTKSSYINRNTVQKVLERQRQAINRNTPNGGTTSSLQFYKSTSNLKPAPSSGLPHSVDRTRKPWEYNSKSHNFTPTAQVVGVIEPPVRTSSGGALPNQPRSIVEHTSDTDFEFPPPPSETDIAQLLSATDGVNGKHNGYHPDNYTARSVNHRLSPRSAAPSLSERKQYPNNTNDSISNQSTVDIVLPPPPEFQEPANHPATSRSVDFMSQQSYGDYELLSPDAGYDYDPWKVSTQKPTKHGSYSYGYKSKDNVEDRKHLSQSRSTNNVNPIRHDSSHPSNQFLHKVYSIARHGHQYSTEL